MSQVVSQLKAQLALATPRDSLRLTVDLAFALREVNAREGLEVSRSGQPQARAERDWTTLASLLLAEALNLDRLGEYHSALAQLEEAQHINGRNNDVTLLSRIWNVRGIVNSNLGRLPEALHYFLLSEGVCEESRNVWLHSAVLNNLGIVYERLGQYDEAFEACQRALRLALSIGREDTKFNAISNLGFVQMGVGLWTEALKYHEEALELARMHDNEYGLVICTANMAESYAALGDHQRAHLLFMEATAKARALGDLEHLVDILNEHAKLYVVAGDQGAATRLLEECLALVQQMGGFHRELTYRVHLAQLLAGMGRTPEALTALDVVPPSHAGALEARSQRLRLLAELHAERGHTELAETYQQQQRDAEQAMKDQAETWASLVPQVEEQVAHWKREAERTGQPRHDAPPDRTGAASPLDLTTLNHHFERAQQTLTDLAVLVIAADRPDRPEVSPALLHEEFRQLVGHLLRAEQPSTIDLGCRTDGSCMFVLPDTSPLAALSAARRVSASLRSGRPPTYAPVQVSVGCCTTTAWSQAEDMLRSAEHFLSQAQGLGGNRVIATGRGRS